MSTTQIQQLHARAEKGQPDAQFLLSQICLQNNDLTGMLHWLQRASASELPDALSALGHCLEKGHGIPQDFVSALAHYDRAIAAGSVPGAYHKAELLYKSQHRPEDNDLICNLLVMAAGVDFIPALRAIGYLAIQNSSSRNLGLDCLRRAANSGDPVSAFNLAWCLLQGWGGNNEQHEAAMWLQHATAAEYPLTETLWTQLQGVQAASPAPTPGESIDFEAPFSLYPELPQVDRRVLSEDPAINVFEHVLNVVDCAYLIYLARPYLKRADVIDPTSHKGGMISDVRTNMSTYLPFGIIDIIGRYIESKIVSRTGEDLNCSEPMSILYYSPGEYYRPHVDYFNPNLKVSKELLENGGQRTASAVTYLIAPTAGGGTSFPKLDLTVPPSAGSTLWFRNCLQGGQVDDRSLHAGDPVEQGEKWVVTKWFRERPTQYLENSSGQSDESTAGSRSSSQTT